MGFYSNAAGGGFLKYTDVASPFVDTSLSKV